MKARQKINLQKWASDLAEQKSSGMTRLEWCRINGINVNTFDRRCKQVRAALDAMSDEEMKTSSLASNIHPKPAEENPIEFARVNFITPSQSNACMKITIGNAAIDVFPGAAESHIRTVLEALSYVK